METGPGQEKPFLGRHFSLFLRAVEGVPERFKQGPFLLKDTHFKRTQISKGVFWL